MRKYITMISILAMLLNTAYAQSCGMLSLRPLAMSDRDEDLSGYCIDHIIEDLLPSGLHDLLNSHQVRSIAKDMYSTLKMKRLGMNDGVIFRLGLTDKAGFDREGRPVMLDTLIDRLVAQIDEEMRKIEDHSRLGGAFIDHTYIDWMIEGSNVNDLTKIVFALRQLCKRVTGDICTPSEAGRETFTLTGSTRPITRQDAFMQQAMQPLMTQAEVLNRIIDETKGYTTVRFELRGLGYLGVANILSAQGKRVSVRYYTKGDRWVIRGNAEAIRTQVLKTYIRLVTMFAHLAAGNRDDGYELYSHNLNVSIRLETVEIGPPGDSESHTRYLIEIQRRDAPDDPIRLSIFREEEEFGELKRALSRARDYRADLKPRKSGIALPAALASSVQKTHKKKSRIQQNI